VQILNDNTCFAFFTKDDNVIIKHRGNRTNDFATKIFVKAGLQDDEFVLKLTSKTQNFHTIIRLDTNSYLLKDSADLADQIHRKPLQKKKMLRSFIVKKLGVYACNRFIQQDNFLTIEPIFSNLNVEQNSWIYHISGQQQTSVFLYKNKPLQELKINPHEENYFLVVLPQGEIGFAKIPILNGADMNKLKQNQRFSMTLFIL
jgi:hypothetical protein